MKMRRRSTDQEIMGDEPEPHEFVSLGLIRIFNWYTYFHNHDDGKKWVLDWMKRSSYPKNEIDDFARSTYHESSLRWPIVARMLVRGFDVDPPLVERLREYIKTAITFIVMFDSVQKKAADEARARKREKSGEVISEIESHVDEFILSGYKKTKVPTARFLQDLNIKPSQIATIKEYYEPLANELKQAIDGISIEAYSSLTGKQQSSYHAFILDLIGCFDSPKTEVKQIPRKPRAKKIIPASSLVKNVKYKREEKSFKLTSVSPETIVGASQVWLYSTKYKILRQLVAQDEKGLTVKGTTVIDFDATASKARTLRKPEVVLKEVLDQTKPGLKRIFDKLTTKPIQVNGRMSDDTIIVRTVK